MAPILTIHELYEAFENRDMERVRSILAPDVEWIQNDGFPGGGTHVGADTVVDKVLARFRSDWEMWEADVEDWIDGGNIVVALGVYRGVHKATGKKVAAPFAHVYDVSRGQVRRFRQYTDTRVVFEATQE